MNNYDSEYDGISNSLHLSGILDPMLSIHTLKLAIADTEDNAFDSAAYITNLQGGTATGGGGVNPPDPSSVPEPAPLLAWGSLVAAGLRGRWHRAGGSP